MPRKPILQRDRVILVEDAVEVMQAHVLLRFVKDPIRGFRNIIESGLGDTFSGRSGHDPGPAVQAQYWAPLAGGNHFRRQVPPTLY